MCPLRHAAVARGQHTVWQQFLMKAQPTPPIGGVSIALLGLKKAAPVDLMTPPAARLQTTTTTLAEPFELRPESVEPLFWTAAAENGEPGLLRQSVPRPDRSGRRDLAEQVAQNGLRKADGDDHLARGLAGPPESVLVVTADGPRQSVARAEVVNGTGLAVIVGKDG